MIRELDCIALLKDHPAEGLRTGDIGAVMYEYDGEAYEVEFVTLTGEPVALLTLAADDIRPARSDELLSRFEQELAAADARFLPLDSAN